MRLIERKAIEIAKLNYDKDVYINSNDWEDLKSMDRMMLDIVTHGILIKAGFRCTLFGASFKIDDDLPSLIHRYTICG